MIKEQGVYHSGGEGEAGAGVLERVGGYYVAAGLNSDYYKQ